MPTVSIDVPLEHEQLVRRVLALQEELTQLALEAPHGTVLDACEEAVVTRSGEIQIQMLQQAVARRIETAEKRGRRSASAAVADPKKIADPRPASAKPPSAS